MGVFGHICATFIKWFFIRFTTGSKLIEILDSWNCAELFGRKDSHLTYPAIRAENNTSRKRRDSGGCIRIFVRSGATPAFKNCWFVQNPPFSVGNFQALHGTNLKHGLQRRVRVFLGVSPRKTQLSRTSATLATINRVSWNFPVEKLPVPSFVGTLEPEEFHQSWKFIKGELCFFRKPFGCGNLSHRWYSQLWKVSSF